MPSSGASSAPRLPAEDSYIELLADTLEGLEPQAKSHFLQRYFRAIANVDLRDDQSLELWDQTLTRRRELSDRLERPIALKTALVDVLSSAGFLRVPIVIEYEELKRLQINAITDPLSGLYNRRLFSETLEKELNRARRYGQPLGLVILDLHRFKEVNDKHGHPTGDEVLRIASATLRKSLRTSDYAFRIGGDEFAILLPQTDASQGNALSRRVSTVFEEALRSLRLGVNVGLDYGLANFPQDSDQADQLIRLADERLYHLKHTNHVRSYERSKPEGEKSEHDSETEPKESQVSAPIAKPISIDSVRPEPKSQASSESSKSTLESEKQEKQPAPAPSSLRSAATASAESISASTREASQLMPRVYTVQRKAERVSMSGTNAYAVLGENGTRRARVLDLGFGGVSLEMDTAEKVPENTLAVLHVPILPPVRVNLRPVWSQKTTQGTQRIGCAFVS